MGQSHVPLKLGVMSRIILYSFLSLTLVALPTYCADGGRVTWYYPCENCSTDFKEQEGCLAANRNNDVIVKDGSSPAKFCEKHAAETRTHPYEKRFARPETVPMCMCLHRQYASTRSRGTPNGEDFVKKCGKCRFDNGNYNWLGQLYNSAENTP